MIEWPTRNAESCPDEEGLSLSTMVNVFFVGKSEKCQLQAQCSLFSLRPSL